MRLGVEIDLVVPDSRGALELYEEIFPVERIEVTGMPRGKNEAVFSILGSRFHLLDENPDYGMMAPKPGDPKPFWLNVVVPEIQPVHQKALAMGCTEVQPLTRLEAFGVTNSMFSDPYGYLWMLHQVHREVSFAERQALLKGTAE